MNAFLRMQKLFQDPPLYMGTVQSYLGDNTYQVERTDGATVRAYSDVIRTPGDLVYFQDGTITGTAPALTVYPDTAV